MAINRSQLTIFRCAFCGELMVDGRKDKKTCSPICRKRYSRWRKRIAKHEASVFDALAELEIYLQHNDMRESAAQVIKGIEIKAKRLLVENRVQEVK